MLGAGDQGPPPQGCSDLTSSQVPPPLQSSQYPPGGGLRVVPEVSTGPHLLLIDWGWKKAIALPTQA